VRAHLRADADLALDLEDVQVALDGGAEGALDAAAVQGAHAIDVLERGVAVP
jgi:hypothetical protein